MADMQLRPFFSDFFGMPLGFPTRREHNALASQLSPFGDSALRCDLVEKDDHFELAVDVPGFSKEEVHLELDHDVLKISAKREEAKEGDEEKDGIKWHRKERSSSSMFRQVKFPQTADLVHISAASADGVLRVTVPKVATAPAAGPHRIDIA